MCDTNLKSSIEAALLYWWWPSCSYTIVRSNKAIGVTMDPPVRNESQMKVILDSGIVTFRDTSRSSLENVRRGVMGGFHLFLDFDCKSMYICNQRICAINVCGTINISTAILYMWANEMFVYAVWDPLVVNCVHCSESMSSSIIVHVCTFSLSSPKSRYVGTKADGSCLTVLKVNNIFKASCQY